MIVNELKTKIMIFGKYESQSFTFNRKLLDIVEEYKYLGVLLNRTNNLRGKIFKNMQEYITTKARKANFATTKKCSSLGYLTPKVAINLFDINVLPDLTYASEIWDDPKEQNHIEKIQLDYLKYILGVKSSALTIAIYGETGRFPIHLEMMCKIIQYWLQIHNLQNHSLTKKGYNTLKEIDNAGYHCWIMNVREILTQFNL